MYVELNTCGPYSSQQLCLCRYKEGILLSAIVYVHDMTWQSRMSAIPYRTPGCKGPLSEKHTVNLVFLTTMWDQVENMEVAEKRETKLKERSWNTGMIHHGATVGRFYSKERYSSKSPWVIVDKIIQRHPGHWGRPSSCRWILESGETRRVRGSFFLRTLKITCNHIQYTHSIFNIQCRCIVDRQPS
jgi:hypothetical protein